MIRLATVFSGIGAIEHAQICTCKKLPADLMYEKYINDETLPLTDLDK